MKRERSIKSKIILRGVLFAVLLFVAVCLFIGIIGTILENVKYDYISDGTFSLQYDYEHGNYAELITDLGYYARTDATREKFALYVECGEGYQLFIRSLECDAAAARTGDTGYAAEAQSLRKQLTVLAETTTFDTNVTVFHNFLSALNEAGE